jgi:prepilin-type N-terminal cleavage/methylation domain-containing protein
MGEAMRNNKNKNRAGFTLLEVIVVVAVIVVLTSIVVSVATRIDSQSKERLTENTFGLLNAALEQYKDFGYQLKDNPASYTTAESDFFLGLQFPIDCNGFTAAQVQTTLGRVLKAPSGVEITPLAAHLDEYSGSEVLYFFLSKVPANKEILSRIGKKLITNVGLGGQEMNIEINGNGIKYPLYRFVDAWGTTLRYDYYYDEVTVYPLSDAQVANMKNSKRSFPLIISAGPDKVFDTADDIVNK